MKSAGLIASNAFIHFRTWNVEHGPTEWDDRDIWEEIEKAVERDDVRAAAGLLRHYLEFVSAEICHYLRAPVEFRGDAQFQLGDLLPPAIGKLSALLREGKSVAQSWGKTDEMKAIGAQEAEFKTRVAATKAEQWQVNSAVHYNSWADLNKDDFKPVVKAYCDLMDSLRAQTRNAWGFCTFNRNAVHVKAYGVRAVTQISISERNSGPVGMRGNVNGQAFTKGTDSGTPPRREVYGNLSSLRGRIPPRGGRALFA